MKMAYWMFVLITTAAFLLSACGPSQSAVQTGAAQTLESELAAAQTASALLTADAQNTAAAATAAAETAILLTQQAIPTETPTNTATSSPTPTRTSPPATPAPTKEPGISVKFDNIHKCEGVDFAMFLVTNVGFETYQSARVVIRDLTTDADVSSADGNNEFMASKNSCPKGNPTLPPGGQAYVGATLPNSSLGHDMQARVTVCTEKGFNGNCRTSSAKFDY